jgi:uncharacterized membrane protein YkvA (DUF1232 family)
VKALVRALPDIVRLMGRLLGDSTLPRTAKIALAAAAVYLFSPIDLIPDVVPFVGYVDDFVLAALLVDGIFNHVERRLLVKYWPGAPETLDRIARVSRVFAAWVPRRLKARIFTPR